MLTDMMIETEIKDGMSWMERALNRTFDVVVAFLALVVLSPVLLVISIVLKREGGGPVLFRQERAASEGDYFARNV